MSIHHEIGSILRVELDEEKPEGDVPLLTQGGIADGPISVNGAMIDPSEMGVHAVIAWVREHPDQVDDVVAAEAAGKARKTILRLSG